MGTDLLIWVQNGAVSDSERSRAPRSEVTSMCVGDARRGVGGALKLLKLDLKVWLFFGRGRFGKNTVIKYWSRDFDRCGSARDKHVKHIVHAGLQHATWPSRSMTIKKFWYFFEL